MSAAGNALLAAPVGFVRMTILVRDLRSNDVIRFVSGAVVVVASVDVLGAVTIVDFTDGTSTAPVLTLGQVCVDRPVVQTGGAA